MEKMLLLVAAVVLLVQVGLYMLEVNKRRRLQKIVQLVGVRQLHELVDGEYQRKEFLGWVDDIKVYRAYEVDTSNMHEHEEIFLLFPLGSGYLSLGTVFTVKDGRICEPSHEMLADLRKELGGKETDRFIEESVKQAVDGIPWPERGEEQPPPLPGS